MDLYEGKINEFIDWMGKDTGGVPVSGKSIRELLLSRLREPFYMFEDVSNNKYRMFSSRDSYAIWKENPTDNQDLELFNFVRPSDYKLELTAINSDGFNNRFIRYGDSTSTGARIAFLWSIYNDEGDSSDSLSVTYTISNSSTGISKTFTNWYNKTDANPDFSIYSYLQPGENIVTIEGKGTTTGARNTKTFTIVLLLINLTSTFKFYEKAFSNVPILIPYVFERNNVSGTAKIYFKIDDGGTNKEASRDVVQNGPTRITEIQMLQSQLSEGTHTLLIWAEAKYNDGNTTVNSNLLYYTFTVASGVIGSTNKFINIATSFDSGDFPLSSLMLNALQYESLQLLWGYYTDSLLSNTSISVTWKLLNGENDQNPTTLGVVTANSQERATTLSYIPTIYTDEEDTYLAAYYQNTLIQKFPIYIVLNTNIIVNEKGFYELKMSAYGRTNESSNKNVWTDVSENTTTTFTGIQWNTNSGWYDNSFRTFGSSEYATINFNPFSNFDWTTGKTIEVEFESEKITNESDKIITIGNPIGARIEITPNKATLYDNSNEEVVHTNYKSNERLKLSFIINGIPEDSSLLTVESGLVYIVNNGILERAASASGKSFVTQGTIKIGGTTSGVRFYNCRIYNYALTYKEAYDNYLYDSDNKAQIADNNKILDGAGNISFSLCKNKIDTILISGNLSNILSGQTDKDTSTTNVTLERYCPFDSTRNFKINNVQIRKHGQSTLNYPITSMKVWLNKSKEGDTPLYESTQQADLLLNKNRYVMKSATDGGKASIPANKFVLQANYADSSGVHNGGLQRLILNTWYNALIDGEFKLRTEPLLFASNQVVHHNNAEIGEDDWTEGYSNVSSKGNVLWNSVSNSAFPYDIRVSPDSFPCAVFYKNEEDDGTVTFLGQYVWMDDKKSDYCYGERSIYAVPSDPFCLTNTHKDDDTKQNLMWDNNNVLRVEIVGSNVPFSSYMTHEGFTDIVTAEINGLNVRRYNWESAFEMIYPDEDDIQNDDSKKGMDKFSAGSKFVQKIQPFVDFHSWVVSTRNNQQKFQQEAAQHLDLYKMAAYYIFVLRFGLVDSLERNALLKTYDGVHWHYEPWDMDIALGNKNDGGIAFDPPINRDTKLPGSVTTYAISGRSANDNGVVVTSNWLFDALEAWPEWINSIVPKVANALYVAGLTYDNITRMFDENYASKWCEIMYNESGFFKYVESGRGDAEWLSWLQGSRMTHRHWWLSTSMDYYDAKWFCGDYKNHYIYLKANITEGSDRYVRIAPNKQTYVVVTKDGVPQGSTQQIDREHPLIFNMRIGSQSKNPIYFYGANFMEEIDVNEIATGFDEIDLNGVYSEVLGSPLKRLTVGIPISVGGRGYTGTLASLKCGIIGNENVFQNLLFLNVRGLLNFTDTATFIYDKNISELKEILAMGAGLTNFYSSESGNKFTNIELPDTVYTIWMNNSSWQTMSFWHTDVLNVNEAEFSQVYSSYNSAGTIPTTVHNVSLLGTTGSTQESILFVRRWLNGLIAADADLSEYTLTMNKINWTDDTVGTNNLLTYEELSYLAQLSPQSSLKGYIVLKDTGTDLTSAQLNSIKSWFGDTVFTKNSSGLIVDHKRQYILINIGGNVTVDQLGDVTLVEGNSASLNATRFYLSEDSETDYQWSIGDPESIESSGRYNGLTVIQASESVDGVAYISSTQSEVGHDYDVKVYASVSGTNYSTTIHVIAASYPTDLFINSNAESNVALKIAPGFIEFPATNAAASFFLDSNQTYSGIIRSVTYTLIRQSDNVSASYITGGDDSRLSTFTDPYIRVAKSTNIDGIKIIADSVMPSEPVFYTLSATATFVSGKLITVTNILVVLSDMDIIVASSKSTLYNPINATWTQLFGAAIGKNNIYKVDLMAITDDIDFSTQGVDLLNFTTWNNDYLFKYLLNCEGIIIDGCTSLLNTTTIGGNSVTLIDFSNMTKLKKLSAQGCTSLSGTLDLSMCSDLREVDLSGTTLNVTLPSNPKITKYELGTPATVNLVNPTSLAPSGVLVDASTNITSVNILNIPNTKTFATFSKIMNL